MIPLGPHGPVLAPVQGATRDAEGAARVLVCVALGAGAIAALSGGACGPSDPGPPPEAPPALRPEGQRLPPPRTRPLPAVPEGTLGAAGDEAPREPPAPAPSDAVDPEPNDTPAQAVPLRPGVPVSGLIAPPEDPRHGDQDWYALDVPGTTPALGRVTLTGASDLDIVLEWVAPRRHGKPRVIVRADVNERRPGPETLTALKLPPGRAYFRVREAWYRGRKRTGSTIPYRLEATLAPWREGTDAEPNDKPKDAIPLAFEALGEGTIGYVDDVDLWRVALPPSVVGRAIQVEVGRIPGRSVWASAKLQGAKLVLRKGGSAKGGPLRLRALYIPPQAGPQPPPLEVRVSADAPSPQASYTLRVSAEPTSQSQEALEAEPNNTRALANLLPRGLGERSVLGYIDCRRDRDVFRLELAEEATLRATLSPPADTDLDLSVSSAVTDGPRSKPFTAHAGGPGAREELRGVGLTPGTWYVQIRGHGRRGFDGQHPYRLQVGLDAGTTGAEREPNDARGDAGVRPLVPGTPEHGWIFPAGDGDWWRLDVGGAPAGSITTVRFRSPPGLAVVVRLHDESGVLRAKTEPTVGDGTLTYFLQPGVYFVRVKAAARRGANPEAPYELELLGG